jgi:hypothetical protein
VTWWNVFEVVAVGLLVAVLVTAALLDRRARATGRRYHPEMGKVYRRRRGELRDAQAADLFRRGRKRPERRDQGEPYS